MHATLPRPPRSLPMPSQERRIGKLAIPSNLRVLCDRCGSEVTFTRGEMTCMDCPISYWPTAGGITGAKGGRTQ
jgi:hypothetical protein